jgi:hypothetical protein
VRRRAGPERRPHFAHFSFRAKPECEYFHPSFDAIHRSVPGRDRGDTDQVSSKYGGCGIFLGPSAIAGSHTLLLRLPLLQMESALRGQLEVTTAQGIRTFRVDQLTKRRLIPLMPNSPLGMASGDSDFAALALAINRELSDFDPKLNIFRGSINGSRIVSPGEPLEWGSTYLLLVRDYREPTIEICELLRWRKCSAISSWSVYEARLPRRLMASKAHLRDEISLFFRRKIETPRPKLAIVSPLPHHFDPDGAYVYHAFPDTILIRRSERLDITPIGRGLRTEEVSVLEHSNEYVSLKFTEPHFSEIEIAIGESRQLLLRKDECDAFRPLGLVASASEVEWNLIEQSPVSDAELFRSVTRIDCRTERLTDYLSKLNPTWARHDFTLSAMKESEKAFNGGAFGSLQRIRKAQCSNEEEPASPGKRTLSPNTALWLQSVITHEFGPQAYIHARRYLFDPSNDNLRLLGPLLYSRWMPHLKAAASNNF